MSAQNSGDRVMKKLIIGLLVAFFAAGNANAALLASYTSPAGGGSSGGSNDGGFFFEFGIDADPLSRDIFGTAPALFGDMLITGDTTITVSSGAGFDEFVALLTDGVNQSFFIADARNIGGSPVSTGVGAGPESGVFGNMMTASLNGIDLSGYVISSIVLTLTDVQAPASANGYSIFYTINLDVFGDLAVSDVPLPAAAPLMLMGLGGLAAMRRRRRAA